MRESRMLDARLETLDAAARRAYLEQRLRETSRRAWGREIGFDDLPALPITRKDALGSMQAANPPFAGLLTGPQNRLQRIFVSPGPTYVPQGPAVDHWRFGMAFAATGFRAGDIVVNTLSYHLTPGGFMRSEEHTSELQSPDHLVCRLLLEKKKTHCDRARPRTAAPC